jgi:hypothetical protein
VLIHCITGISRSAAVIAAILIAKHKMSLLDAVKLLRARRSVVCINPGFILNLLQLEESLEMIPSNLSEGVFFLVVVVVVVVVVSIGLVLVANGSDARSFLKKVGQVETAHASHIWWTPQFRPEDSFRVPINLRSALAIANAAFANQGSNLMERREGRFRKHFDVDVVVEDAFCGTIQSFFELAMEDISAVLSKAELASLSVSGFAGPFRGETFRFFLGVSVHSLVLEGRFKYGLHLTCGDELVCEEEFVARTIKFRNDLKTRKCEKWIPSIESSWNEIVDEMESKTRRCFGSDRVVTCNQCRKKSAVDPQCSVCFGNGLIQLLVRSLSSGYAQEWSLLEDTNC